MHRRSQQLAAAEPEAVAVRLAARVASVGACVALAIGLLIVASYWLELFMGLKLTLRTPGMKPNTALCLVLLGSSTLLLTRGLVHKRGRYAALGSASAAALVAQLSLIEDVFGLELGIDRLLVGNFSSFARMSPLTACALSCLATVTVLSALRVRAAVLCQTLLLLTALFSMLPLMGYLYHASFLYDPGTTTAVAPGTALGVLGLTLALVALRCDEGLWPLLMGSTAGSSLLRRALPVVVILPVTFGWLRLEAERLGQLGTELGVALIAAATVLTFAVLLLWSARWLRSEDLARRAAIEKLRDARSTLEARVDERTRELQDTEVELRRAATKLLLAKEAAEAAMQARTDFLARMSHEMRTPLNGVVGMLEIALRSDLTPVQRGYVQTARTSADALLGLISDTLDFSKIDAGKLLLEATSFRLRDCVAQAVRDSAHAAHQKGLELSMVVAGSVPECLVGDAQRLRQVVTNLVSNAAKFTLRGEVCVSVTLERRTHAAVNLRVEVRDTGIGIPKSKQREIFEPFTQADETTTRRFGGTGLGLAICAQLVQLMGGDIQVESEPDKGARFFFSVELRVDHEAELLLDQSRAAFAGKRLLVVEPHPPHREFVLELLERWGIDAVTSDERGAAQSLRQARERGLPYSLMLLSDEAVSHLGAPFFSDLRAAAGPGFPFVLLTLATASNPAREIRLRYAAMQLTKPVVSSELFEVVAGLLTAPRLPPEQPRASREAPQRVLLAEDNEVNRRVARFLLEDAGYTVVAVENGRKALLALAEHSFDVVLMDGHMPELDGIEATREIRARERGTGRHMPIVALTAQAMKGDRERYLAAGMDGYLTKPFQSAQLIAAIREAIARSALGAAQQLPEAEAAQAERTDASRLTTPLQPALPVYDREQLCASLRGAEGMLREIVAAFAEEAPEMLAALCRQVEANEAQGVERAAHKLVGALAMLNAKRAAQTARSMEQAAKLGDLSHAAASLRQLTRELATLQRAFIAEGDLQRPPPASIDTA